MKKIIIAAFAGTLSLSGLVLTTAPVLAAPVPCENMLKDMRAAKASASLNAEDAAKVDALETKAVERCNADDDLRSDQFLSEAMKILGH